MTCGFCGYEFCYYCGGSASSGSGHWNGLGCGVGQFGETMAMGKLGRTLYMILKVIGAIIMYPLVVILVPPLFLTAGWIATCCKINPGCGCVGLLLFPIPFAIGLVLDICWIPFCLIAYPTAIITMGLGALAEKISNK